MSAPPWWLIGRSDPCVATWAREESAGSFRTTITRWRFTNRRDADARQVREAARTMTKRRVYGHTKSGHPITDEDVEKLAAEAEAGYDVEQLIGRRNKRGGPAI